MRCVLPLLSLPSSPSGRYTLRGQKDILPATGMQPAAPTLPDERQRLLQELLKRSAVAARYLFGAFDRRVVLRVVAHEARQLHGAILPPLLDPILGHLVGQLLVGEGGPERCPDSGDDAPDVVAAATDGYPAPLAELVGELVDASGHVLVDTGRHREVRQRVEVVGVAAVLGEDKVRPKGPQNLGHDLLEALDKGVVLGERLQGQVDGVSLALLPSQLLYAAGARKEVAPRLVRRERQDVRVIVEHPLHPVAVVDVGIYVGDLDTRVLLFEARDGDRGIVVDAEATRLPFQGVVEPAGDAQSVLRLPVHDEPRGPEHPAYHVGARPVKVGEDRVVLRAEPVLLELLEVPLAPAGLLHAVHVARVVHGGQVLLRRRLGRDERVPFQEPQRLAQLDGHPEPHGVERVVLAEPVLLQRLVVDEGRSPAHGRPALPAPGGQRTAYPAASRPSTTLLGSMVSILKTATRSPDSSSPFEEARTLTMFTPALWRMPATPANAPGRRERATSTRLPGAWAPTSRTNALMTSEEVTMPTRLPSSTTGRQPIFLSYISIAASSMGSSGRTVATSSAAVVSGPTVTTSRVIESRTSSISPSPERRSGRLLAQHLHPPLKPVYVRVNASRPDAVEAIALRTRLV